MDRLLGSNHIELVENILSHAGYKHGRNSPYLRLTSSPSAWSVGQKRERPREREEVERGSGCIGARVYACASMGVCVQRGLFSD